MKYVRENYENGEGKVTVETSEITPTIYLCNNFTVSLYHEIILKPL